MSEEGPRPLSVEILKQIRGEVRETATRLDERLDRTNERLDRTNERLDQLRAELIERIAESELRTATAITDLAGTVRELTMALRGQLDFRPRLERCEQHIIELREWQAAVRGG